MRAAINQTLDLLDRMLEPGGPTGKAMHRELRANIEQVQDNYIEVVQQALRLLMLNRVAESHELLQQQRDDLASTFARIGTLIEDISEEDEPLIKATVEYLFTRARLVDELKMFPAFGVELLERMSLDDSIDATVEYMEAVMIGKKHLYRRVVNALAKV
jgi:hypothetical protein